MPAGSSERQEARWAGVRARVRARVRVRVRARQVWSERQEARWAGARPLTMRHGSYVHA